MSGALAQITQPAAITDDEISSKIEKLGGLLAKGLISQTEFDQSKAELLKKLIG